MMSDHQWDDEQNIEQLEAEVERLKLALLKIIEVDDDMGIYPAAVKGFNDERGYEQRNGYMNGWNAAVTEFTGKVATIVDDVFEGYPISRVVPLPTDEEAEQIQRECEKLGIEVSTTGIRRVLSATAIVYDRT